mgnify:CR=1 FL=1
MKPISLDQHESTTTMTNVAKRALFLLLLPLIAVMVFLVKGMMTGVFAVLLFSFLGFIVLGPKLLEDFRDLHDQKFYSELLKSDKPISVSKAHEVIRYFNATVLRIDSRKGIIQVMVNGGKYTMNVYPEKQSKIKQTVEP